MEGKTMRNKRINLKGLPLRAAALLAAGAALLIISAKGK